MQDDDPVGPVIEMCQSLSLDGGQRAAAAATYRLERAIAGWTSVLQQVAPPA